MSNNPFEFMQSFINQNIFSKTIKNMPAMDLQSFNNMVKNNANAIFSSSQLAAKNIQSVAEKATQSFQQNNAEMFNTAKESLSAGNFSELASTQQKYVKNSMENNINNSREIFNISAKAYMEIFDKVSNTNQTSGNGEKSSKKKTKKSK